MDTNAPEQDELDFFQETDEDQEIGRLSAEDFNRLVVYSSDWTTETLLMQISKQNIDLNPRFQRRDAWKPKRKSQFIESLIIGIPVPQLVFAEISKGRFYVIDGKQRILAIHKFCSGTDGTFKLRDLEILPQLNGKTYKDVCDDSRFSEYARSFENATIRCAIIRDCKSEAVLRMIFHRLNTGSVKLSPQELRLAWKPGWFADFVDDAASESAAIRELLSLTEPDFRMRDVELLARFLAFQNRANYYAGNMSDFIDKAYDVFNANDDLRVRIEEQTKEFEAAVSSLIGIYTVDGVGRNITRSRKPFNRALFDVQAYYWADPELRGKLSEKKDAILSGTKLLLADQTFVSSIEKTTKSIDAVNTRFRLWAKLLNDILGIDIKPPQFNIA